MQRRLALLYLIAAMSMTGANVPLAKLLVAAFPIDVLLLIRFTLASILLALLVPGEPGPRLRSLGVHQWGAIAVLGLVGSVAFTWAVVEGVKRTSGASAGIIMAALPAVVALIGIVLGERLRRGDIVMVGLAVAGIALIQGQASATAGSDQRAMWDQLTGNLLIGLAVACEAAFVIVARKISRQLGPLRLSLAVALVSLAVCLPTGIVGLTHFHPGAVEPKLWALLVWYTVTASVLCTALWYRGVGHVATWVAGLATAAVPVAALAVSALLLGERIAPAQLAGAVLVIGAIAAGTLSRR